MSNAADVSEFCAASLLKVDVYMKMSLCENIEHCVLEVLEEGG